MRELEWSEPIRKRDLEALPRSVCAISLVALALLLGVTILYVGRLTPLTADENNYIAAGMALRGEFAFDVRHTYLHGPLTFFANQIAAWFGADFDIPFDGTENNKILARAGMIVFPMLALGFLARLTWRSLGPRAAVAAALLFGINPLVLGHGCLTAADMALTAGFLWTALALVRYLEVPTAGRGAILGASISLAVATKYAALLLVPIGAICISIALWSQRRPERVKATLGHAGLALAVGVVVSHATYLFRGGFYDPNIHHSESGWLDSVPGLSTLCRILPAPLVHGIDFQMSANRKFTTTAFLGELSDGHWAYYLVGLGTKLPIALLALLALSIAWHRASSRLPRETAWVVTTTILLPLVYFSLFSGLQIGVRYVLPVVPFLILLAVRPVEPFWAWGGRWRLLLATFLVWHASFTVTHWPNYVSAFNVFAGNRPYLLFGDSTMDWQHYPSSDPALARLQARHPGTRRAMFESGPRIGDVIAYAMDMWPRLDARHGPVKHWLRDLDPADEEGPFYFFRVTEDHFRLTYHANSGTAAVEARRNLAIALLGVGKWEEVERLLEHGEDLPVVRQQLQALTSEQTDQRKVIAGWSALHRYDKILVDPRATATDRALAHFARREYRSCRRILEPERSKRQLSAVEALALSVAQLRDRAIDQAIITAERHPPPLGTPAHAAHVKHIETLRSHAAEFDRLLKQIQGRNEY